MKDPKSYRPICLLPVIGKLFEKLLKMRLTDTALAPGRVSDRQFEQVDGRHDCGAAAGDLCLRREVHCGVALRHFRCL